MAAPAPSWVASANRADSDFPLANLPYGVYRAGAGAHPAVAIGDQLLDLHAAHAAGLLAGLPDSVCQACRAPVLNPLMSLGREQHATLRTRLQELLAAGAGEPERTATCLRPRAAAEMLLPAAIGDYTDFYASRDHAFNVGSLFRPNQPLMANYLHLPVGYHGRSSSIGVSPARVQRPSGQRPAPKPDTDPPDFGPSRQLDYELEVGFFVSRGNPLGQPIPLAAAGDAIFGLTLLNDWSARDIQRWEYQPLGPFLGKNFATTISPWVVPWEALQPYRIPARARAADDPALLPYLDDPADRASGGLDMNLEVYLSSASMRERDLPPLRLSRGNLSALYWTMAQMVAHHTSNGCNLRPGDLLATGTVSGPERDQRGCLLELAAGPRGPSTEPVVLPTGEKRTALLEGDEVIFRAWCERSGQPRVGWGECRGLILPAVAAS